MYSYSDYKVFKAYSQKEIMETKKRKTRGLEKSVSVRMPVEYLNKADRMRRKDELPPVNNSELIRIALAVFLPNQLEKYATNEYTINGETIENMDVSIYGQNNRHFSYRIWQNQSSQTEQYHLFFVS